MKLIADSSGDYRLPDGTWSTDANGGGWIHDLIQALPGGAKQIDAFSVHPYGPVDALIDGEDRGWLEVPRYHDLAVANGVNVPWYVTEVGQPLGGSDLPAVSAATQAADVARYLDDVAHRYRYVTYLDFYAIKDDSTGRWGFLNVNRSARPSFTALQRWIASHGLG